MIRNIFLIVFIFAILFTFSAYGTDNSYGDFLISGSDKVISFDLESAKLIDVLKALSQQAGLNFVSTEIVKDRLLTFYLDKAPLKEAIDVIFKANNLAYDYFPEANIFLVKEMGKPSIELKTKVYNLKYARVGNSRLGSEITTLLGAGGTTGGIAEAIKKNMSEFGNITENSATNSLIITDVPSQFPVIDNIVANLDVLSPQVLIDVEMLDVSKLIVDKLGVKFENGITAKLTPAYKTTAFPWPSKFSNGTNDSLTFGSLSLADMTMLIQFLETDTTTKTIARPRILTLANETAEVKLTTDEAVGITTMVTDGTTTQTVERVETGTKLRVTPQINPLTNEITMVVEVFNKDAKDSGLSLTGSTSGKVKNTEERGTKTVIRLADGETLFLGGLIKKSDSKIETKVPILSDIPLLGKLFEHDDNSNNDRELLVFLTPHILGEKALLSADARKVIPKLREQNNALRTESIRGALDKFSPGN
jgi:type II secretory pathway component GspD/PulD (secretin)